MSVLFLIYDTSEEIILKLYIEENLMKLFKRINLFIIRQTPPIN